jgi:hypothetical protein
MSKATDLITELREALIADKKAEAAYNEARAISCAKRAEWAEKKKAVTEIESEIWTGSSGRGIIDQVGVFHTSEPINGVRVPSTEETKAKLAQDALDDLLHSKHRRRKAVGA